MLKQYMRISTVVSDAHKRGLVLLVTLLRLIFYRNYIDLNDHKYGVKFQTNKITVTDIGNPMTHQLLFNMSNGTTNLEN